MRALWHVANTVKLPCHAALANMVGMCMPSPSLKPSSLSHEWRTWAPCECTCMQNSRQMHSEIMSSNNVCYHSKCAISSFGSVSPRLSLTRMKMPAFPSELFKFWQNTNAGTTATQKTYKAGTQTLLKKCKAGGHAECTAPSKLLCALWLSHATSVR